MLVVGLTGGIGCGKSLVSDLFNQFFSIPIIDADIIAQELTQSDHVIDAISSQIGKQYIENGKLLREKLREAIFSDSSLKTKLENILHPLVYDEIERQLKKVNSDYCIVVIPLLLEKNRTSFLDRILVVDCSIDEQIERVMRRDKCSELHVKSIIASQIDRESRLSLSDDIIENSSNIESLKNKVTSLHKKYLKLSRSKTQL